MRSSAVFFDSSSIICWSSRISRLIRRISWRRSCGSSADSSSSRSKGISHTEVVSSACADTGYSSPSMPDRPTSSLGRWKPVSCSMPSSLRLKVFRLPERTANTELKASPWRNRNSPFFSGRPRLTISSSASMSSRLSDRGRHRLARLQSLQLTWGKARTLMISDMWGHSWRDEHGQSARLLQGGGACQFGRPARAALRRSVAPRAVAEGVQITRE
ncbi:hypothetical protein D9M70_330390 [compost metagenome]